jgi:hypothetical protein
MQLSSAFNPNCRLESSGRYNGVHAPRLCVAAAAPTKPRPHQKRALHIVRVATPEVVSQHTMYVSGHAPCQLGRLTAVLLERNSGHHPEHWTPQGARCTAATEGGSSKRSCVPTGWFPAYHRHVSNSSWPPSCATASMSNCANACYATVQLLQLSGSPQSLHGVLCGIFAAAACGLSRMPACKSGGD